MILNFILPHLNISGGVRLILTMARQFSFDGNEVNIISLGKKNCDWFNLHENENIHVFKIEEITNETIPDGNFVFIYENGNCKAVMDLSPNKGKKCLILQEFLHHNWEKELYNISLSWDKIFTVSEWLQTVAGRFNHHSCNIQIPLDHNVFYPREKELSNYVGMLYSEIPWKGSLDGIKSFELSKKKNSKLKLIMFGNNLPDFELPKDSMFFLRPPQSMIPWIYSNADLWIVPSFSEGFTWVLSEAASCGTTLLISDHQGAFEFARHMENSYIFRVGDITGMAEGIDLLMDNEELRKKLSEEGLKTAEQFSMKNSFKRFKKYLLK